jgi:hypothetical protein
VECLEDRLTPASFNLMYSGGSLTIVQTTALAGASNTLNITDNVTPNMIVLTDAGTGGNTNNVDVTGVTNVTLNLLANTVAGTPRTITYDLGAAGRPGDLKLNLSNGDQSLDINDNGGTGPVGDDLKISAGNGADTITAAATGSVAVTDTTSISLGNGDKTIALGNTALGNNLKINVKNGTDSVSLGASPGQTFTVAGNVDIDTGNGNNSLTMGFVGIGTAAVSGNLDAGGMTFFSLGTGSSVGGRVSLDAEVKPMTYTFNTGSSVGGTVSIRNEGSTPLASSSLQFNGTIGKDLRITLGNTAGDSVSVSGSVGREMEVNAGSHGKTITLSSTATIGSDFEARLGNALGGANIVSITGGASVGRNVYVRLGSTSTGGSNLVDLSGALIGGSVNVRGGSGTNTYLSSSSADAVNGPTSIGGNVSIDFDGTNNSATISGSVGGSSIRYSGGHGNDTVTVDATSFAVIHIDLETAPAGSKKIVTLGVRPKSAFIDFGVGSGTKTLNLTGTATPVTYSLTVKNK